MNKYIIEFIGTFFLVLTVGLSGNPIAIGAVLGVMVYMGGYISGGHYNPAVTLGVWLQKKIKSKQALLYMVTQLLGGLAAAAVYQAVHGGKMAVAPGQNVGFWAALLVEMIFTFALVSVVLHTAVNNKSKNNQYYGLAIGAVLMVAAFSGGAISGGAFNTSVGLAPNLYHWSALTGHFGNFWLYLVGPFAGGAIASLVYGVVTKE